MKYSDILAALKDYEVEIRSNNKRIGDGFRMTAAVFDSIPLIEDKWKNGVLGIEDYINQIADIDEKAHLLRMLNLFRAESTATHTRLGELYALMQANNFMDLMGS